MEQRSNMWVRFGILLICAFLCTPGSSYFACGGGNDQNNANNNNNTNTNDSTKEQPSSTEEKSPNGDEKAPEDASTPPEEDPKEPDPKDESCNCTKGDDGAKGPPGDKGPTGDKGPSWNPSFEGITAAKTNGSAGGWKGMKAKCTKEYPGSHVCSERELMWMLQRGSVPSSLNNAAWILGSSYRLPNDAKVSSNCSGWDSADPSDMAATIVPKNGGNFYFYSSECNDSKPIACCKD